MHKGADAIQCLAEASAKRTKLAADLLMVEEERARIELFSMPETNPDLKKQFIELSQLRALEKLRSDTRLQSRASAAGPSEWRLPSTPGANRSSFENTPPSSNASDHATNENAGPNQRVFSPTSDANRNSCEPAPSSSNASVRTTDDNVTNNLQHAGSTPFHFIDLSSLQSERNNSNDSGIGLLLN